MSKAFEKRERAAEEVFFRQASRGLPWTPLPALPTLHEGCPGGLALGSEGCAPVAQEERLSMLRRLERMVAQGRLDASVLEELRRATTPDPHHAQGELRGGGPCAAPSLSNPACQLQGPSCYRGNSLE